MPPMDRELVLRAQEGDRDAFADLATAMYSRLHRVAQNVLSDVHLAEDATQTALLEMWRNLPRLRDPERFEAWAYRIVVNACRREGRNSRRWMQAISPAPEEDVSATAGFSAVAHRDQLERGFRHLPIEQREVVVLHYYAALPLREVAEVLKIPTGTAHSRLDRAMKALRAALEADDRLPDPNATSPRSLL
jgi:RNA polymerase sigma factor (sigma-70 family)